MERQHLLGRGHGERRRWSRSTNGWPTTARVLRWGVRGWLATALALGAPGMAAAQLSVESRAPAMRAGEFIWRDDAPAEGAVTIVIGLEDQLAHVYRGGKLLGISTVSTGKRSKRTPTGIFNILQKKTFHRSNLYSNAPMPYMQRLTWSGIAMHAGHLPGYPASHGCIRFPGAFAKRLFELTELGGSVRVVETLGAPAPLPPALPRMVVADARAVLRHDDAARAGADTASPRLALSAAHTAFAAYDAVFAGGYGAKSGAAP